MNLIDKDAVISEIERRMQCYSSEGCEPNAGKWVELISIEHFLNTLEVKEVNLEKEYKEFVEDDLVYGRLVNNIVGKAIAKHFFELGMAVRNKAQKG